MTELLFLHQCSHKNFKLFFFIPPVYEIWGYEVNFEGMTWKWIKTKNNIPEWLL